ncbi:hypothetical protein IFM89_037372 [Coptis chinensis]|uniref:C2 domain-containing protein n=1 Tax=Coptis chinensis TaxID=261450 RepID=A0A835M3B6_9MAGN|nr:hypothetical protein IFM89_037372 [Coptis chinensis]
MEKSLARSLEVTIISAEDLRINHRSIKKNAFVTVQTDPNNSRSTNMDTEGASYPSWNEKLELALPSYVKHIRVDVKCKTSSGERTIGSANIPLTDFLDDYIPPNCLHFLSYRLREHDGDRNGIVNISIRLNAPDYVPRALPSLTVQAGYRNSNACGWMPSSRIQTPYNNSRGSFAIGIPVSKGYIV